MTLAVIIPTLGREMVVARLLAHLGTQSRPPDHVFVSAPDQSHVDIGTPPGFPLTILFGGIGSCAQRNRALDLVVDQFDIVTFLDDDFLPANDYFENVERAFDANADYVVLMGDVLRDGAHNAGFSFDEGLEILQRAADEPPDYHEPVEHPGAYGCNMSIRTSAIGSLRFDEALALYGWQEDIDFTSQLRHRGRIMRLCSLLGVHLGLKGGRVSGVRFGYSQIVNPVYLVRKGTMSLGFALDLVMRNILANIGRSIRPEPYVDRRGRLKGNLLGLRHVLSGRVQPDYILEL